ncbi:MAG TPA: hypothetical protein VNA66_10165 [Gammaproteobacteria bacterium]|nr:hypothetical protein [Gammaproteobacteria bacterium]
MAEAAKPAGEGDTKTNGDESGKSGDNKPNAEGAAAAAGAKKDGEAAPAGKKDGDGKSSEEKPGEKPAGPPADGNYELEAPKDAIVDDADLEKIAAVAKEKGWSNEQAQAALEEYDGALKAQSKEFLKELKADKELGGKKLEETQRLSNLALDTIMPADEPGGEELRSLLKKSGYGNNTLIVRFLSKIGKMLGEDGATKITGKKADEVMRPEDRMYPTTRQKPEDRG